VWRAALASVLLLVACGGSTASSVDGGGWSDASADAPSTACAQMGGECEPTKPQNMSCAALSGTYYEVRVDFCAASGDACCIARDANGNLPAPLRSFIDCGPLLCPPGTTCSHGTDFVQCVASSSDDAGARD
jgi:hypothetical protein